MVDTSRLAAVALLMLAACQKLEPPRALSLDFPDLIASADPVRVIVRMTKSDGARVESDGRHESSVAPPDLASIGKDGSLRCARSGDGTVTAKIGDVQSSRALRCRLVASIEFPDLGRIEMNKGAFDPKLRVLDKAGRDLADVPVSLTSSAPSVIKGKGAELVPLAVGSAVLRARAGAVTKEVKIQVARRLTPEALPLDDNRRIHYSLDAGKYELTLSLPSPHKVGIEWRGAPYCGSSATGTEHSSTCTLQGKGGVVFDNPGFLKDGTKTVSTEGVSLFEIP